MRGEFKRGDGLRIPNNITVDAAGVLLRMALRDADNIDIYAGLCRAAPDPYLDLNQITEPTIGVNGYERILIPRTNSGWPVLDKLADETYIETRPLTWVATGTGFDEGIDRVFLATSGTALTGPVFAVSSLLPEVRRIKPETHVDLRRFTYTLFLR